MPSAKPKLSLIAKLATISGELGPIAKGQKHQQGYSFRGIDDLYNAVNPLFSKYLIFITSEILFQEVKEAVNDRGKTAYYNRVNVRFTFHDGESEEKVVTDMLAGSMDYSDKSEVQAMSMAKKYALIQVLNVTTQDTRDPDHSTAELPDKKTPKTETKVYSIPEGS